WDNGGGVPANYFLAGQPAEMVAAIRRVFGMIVGSSGTIAGVGLSSTRLGADGIHVYQPGFEPSRWSGSLRKLAIGFDPAAGLTIADDPIWDAGVILTGTPSQAPTPAPNARRIHTLAVTPNGPAVVPFTWEELDAASREALDRAPDSDEADGLGQARLEWLRGVREHEIGYGSGIFRARDRVLGDVVGSNPIYVGGPTARALGEGYADFLAAAKHRKPAVYVGAN